MEGPVIGPTQNSEPGEADDIAAAIALSLEPRSRQFYHCDPEFWSSLQDGVFATLGGGLAARRGARIVGFNAGCIPHRPT